jgi:uncharacterized membrane protein (DUF4010 family)
MASLVTAGKATPGEIEIPILAALSTNTLAKILFAATSSGRLFAMAVIPGLVLVALAAWGGALLHV